MHAENCSIGNRLCRRRSKAKACLWSGGLKLENQQGGLAFPALRPWGRQDPGKPWAPLRCARLLRLNFFGIRFARVHAGKRRDKGNYAFRNAVGFRVLTYSASGSMLNSAGNSSSHQVGTVGNGNTSHHCNSRGRRASELFA